MSHVASTVAIQQQLNMHAIKACGSIISIAEIEFQAIVARSENPLVVWASGGFFSTSYKYLTSYRGLTFFCKSKSEITFPQNVELINAKKISIPDI